MSESGGFEFVGGMPIPPEIGELLSKLHDRAHMTAEAEAARVDNFLANLDVDGLLALRAILNTGDMKASASANFWDGQLVSILKFIRKVDPATGQPDPLTAPPVE
jgi:hypothetical protein